MALHTRKDLVVRRYLFSIDTPAMVYSSTSCFVGVRIYFPTVGYNSKPPVLSPHLPSFNAAMWTRDRLKRRMKRPRLIEKI